MERINELREREEKGEGVYAQSHMILLVFFTANWQKEKTVSAPEY